MANKHSAAGNGHGAQAISSVPWRNRIVGYGEEEAEQLLANPKNFRIHPKNQQLALENSLDKLGWIQNCVVNQTTGFVVDGHARAALAISRGEKVPCAYVELSPEEEAVAIAILDSITEMAVKDQDILGKLIDDIRESDLGQNLGAGLDELLESLSPKGMGTVEGEDDVPPVPETPVSRLNDLWLLGEHRVLCGDSTSPEAVARLMGGEKADMVFTDPPYGVGYDGGTTAREKLAGDETTALYDPCCKMAALNSRPEASLYLWHAGVKGIAAAAAAAAAAAGYQIRCELVWNKNLAQFGSLSSQYKQKHEPCYYCFKRGQVASWYGPTNEVTVWDCARASVNEFHPTQKPVELAERAMGNSSKRGDLILDLFLGSGATLIACEKIGRACYGMELAPEYVDVICMRWAGFTSKQPTLDGDGRTFEQVKAERLHEAPNAEPVAEVAVPF